MKLEILQEILRSRILALAPYLPSKRSTHVVEVVIGIRLGFVLEKRARTGRASKLGDGGAVRRLLVGARKDEWRQSNLVEKVL